MRHKQYLPLSRRLVLVTRAREQAKPLADGVSSLGGIAVCYPLLTIRSPSDAGMIRQLDLALRTMEHLDWIIFTSVNGVKYYFQRLHRLMGSSDLLPSRIKIVAVGSETAKALEQLGITAIYPLVDYQQEGIVELLRPLIQRGDRVLLPTAAVTRDVLRNCLADMGAIVNQVTVYENVYNDIAEEKANPEILTARQIESRIIGKDTGDVIDIHSSIVVEMLVEGMIDFIPLTSSSNVHHLLEFMARHHINNPQQVLNATIIVCIGEITARTAEAAGLHVRGIASKATVSSLVETMVNLKGISKD